MVIMLGSLEDKGNTIRNKWKLKGRDLYGLRKI